jgi:hypothetical protein
VIWVGGRAALRLGCAIFLGGLVASSTAAADFQFKRDTLAFENSTVFEYHEGVASLRRGEKEKSPRYTRRCFTMCRTVLQFQKFARFDPRGTPLNDKDLAERVRQVAKNPAWRDPMPADQRIVIPGYSNLRQLSEKRGWVLQKNIGLGWPTYVRIGNYRMFYKHDREYQSKMRDQLNATLDRHELFVAYLSDFPTLHINHAVLVYERKPSRSKDNTERYNCYDPNHADGPRELVWSKDKKEFSFEKDQEFVGGFARVFRVYGTPLQ